MYASAWSCLGVSGVTQFACQWQACFRTRVNGLGSDSGSRVGRAGFGDGFVIAALAVVGRGGGGVIGLSGSRGEGRGMQTSGAFVVSWVSVDAMVFRRSRGHVTKVAHFAVATVLSIVVVQVWPTPMVHCQWGQCGDGRGSPSRGCAYQHALQSIIWPSSSLCVRACEEVR